MSTIDVKTVDAIRMDAEYLSKLQREINRIEEAIGLLNQQDEGVSVAVNIEYRYHGDPVRVEVSRASALCLMREAIEIAQRRSEMLSKSLRSRLKDE